MESRKLYISLNYFDPPNSFIRAIIKNSPSLIANKERKME
jgi:hypothetical protein